MTFSHLNAALPLNFVAPLSEITLDTRAHLCPCVWALCTYSTGCLFPSACFQRGRCTLFWCNNSNINIEWIWGEFSIDNATSNRFHSFHFTSPLNILFLVLVHLFFLHLRGPNNTLGINRNKYKIPFHLYFRIYCNYNNSFSSYCTIPLHFKRPRQFYLCWFNANSNLTIPQAWVQDEFWVVWILFEFSVLRCLEVFDNIL